MRYFRSKLKPVLNVGSIKRGMGMTKLLLLLVVAAGAAILGTDAGTGAAAQTVSGKTTPDPLSSAEPYVLGPGDHIVIHALHADELSDKQFRVDTSGDVDLPLIGKKHPGGKTLDAFEAEVRKSLEELIRDPQVSISVSQYRTEQATFNGAFTTPGVYSLQGHRTLTEMLVVVGGLSPKASRLVQIRRAKDKGTIPLNSATQLPDGSSVVAIDISVPEGKRIADEFSLLAFDIVTAKEGDPIFVTGEVARVGVINLEDRQSLSLQQVVAMSGGLTKDASTKVRIYRPIAGSTRKEEISINFQKILKGEEPDVAVLPRDVVIASRATARVAAERAAAMASSGALSVITGLAIAH